MKSYRIYCYTNLITGQKYIGCTCQRFQSGRAGKNGKNYLLLPYFGESIKEYGWENFKYEVFEDGLTKEDASLREQYWIAELNTLYPFGLNSQSGGKIGMKQDDRTKQKQSQLMMGHLVSEETKEKLRVSNIGKHLTEETKKKISKSLMGKMVGENNPMYGKQWTEEQKEKLSNLRKSQNNHWWNNGVIQTYQPNCPDGFVPGRLFQRRIRKK